MEQWAEYTIIKTRVCDCEMGCPHFGRLMVLCYHSPKGKESYRYTQPLIDMATIITPSSLWCIHLFPCSSCASLYITSSVTGQNCALISAVCFLLFTLWGSGRGKRFHRVSGLTFPVRAFHMRKTVRNTPTAALHYFTKWISGDSDRCFLRRRGTNNFSMGFKR